MLTLILEQLRRVLTAGAIWAAATLFTRADEWPQWLGPQRDGVWRETGLVEKFPAGGPPVRWRVPVGGGYAGPAVAGGRVFVTDRQLAAGAKNSGNAFGRDVVPGTERVLCFNETDGQPLWKHEYDCPYSISYGAGPRTTPIVSGGKVFTLGAEGNLFCFDAASGAVRWARDFKKEFGASTPLWGFSAHPLLEGNRLISLVGGTNSAVVAFDAESGREIWRALTTRELGYCPPTMIEIGGQRQLILWHGESVNGLEPATGRVLWTVPWVTRFALTAPTPRLVGDDRVFLTAFYDGSMMLKLDAQPPGATVLWKSQKASERDTTELHSIMSTPFVEGDVIYGVCSYGQLRALRIETGARLWETLAATTHNGKEVRWGNAFLVKHADRFFLFNELGDLIIAKLTPAGYEEISRAHVIEPVNELPGRRVVWSHPAFANKAMFVRNDLELVAVSLAK